jgi:hypothetical protein
MQIKGDRYKAGQNKEKISQKLMRLLPDNLESIEIRTNMHWLAEHASTWQVQQQQLLLLLLLPTCQRRLPQPWCSFVQAVTVLECEQLLDIEWASRCTQLTKVAVHYDHSDSLAQLAALSRLRSLTLDCGPLQHLDAVATGCTALTQLHLVDSYVTLPLPHPNSSCVWPSLQELQLIGVKPGVLSVLLPSRGAAPQLCRILPPQTPHEYMLYTDQMPPGWSPTLQYISLCFSYDMDDDALALEVTQLVSDISRMAECQVPCQALRLDVQAHMTSLLPQLASVLSTVQTLTHLYIFWELHLSLRSEIATPMATCSLQLALSIPHLTHLTVRSPFDSRDNPLGVMFQQRLISGWRNQGADRTLIMEYWRTATSYRQAAHCCCCCCCNLYQHQHQHQHQHHGVVPAVCLQAKDWLAALPCPRS